MKYRALTLRASAAYIGFEGLSRRCHELLNMSWSCIHGDDDDLDFEESRTYLKTKALPPTGTLLCLLRHILYHCIEVALGIRLDSRSDRYVGKVDAAVIAHAEEISFSAWFVVVVGMVQLVYDCGKGLGTRYLGRGT